MQWKHEFCAVTFKEISEVIYTNVALYCSVLAVKLQFTVFRMHTGDLRAMTRVV